MSIDTGGEGSDGDRWAVWRRRRVRVYGVEGSIQRPVIFLALAIVLAYLITPSFVRPANLNALLISSAALVVVSVGEAFVILVGSIDLGVQSVLASMAMFAGFLGVLNGVPAPATIIITLIGAALLGAGVGLLVTRLHIPSFIVTLGTYWGMRGVALLLNGGNYISPDSVSPARPFGFVWLASSPLHVSGLIIVMVLVVVVAQSIITFTPIGMRLKAVGSSELAARRVGLTVNRLKIGVFVVSAVLAALAGLMLTAYQGSIYPDTGSGYSLEAIAAVILGGIPFMGGRGSVVGAALGALLIGIINDVIVLLGLPSLYEYIFVALVLLVAGLQARGGMLVK